MCYSNKYQMDIAMGQRGMYLAVSALALPTWFVLTYIDAQTLGCSGTATRHFSGKFFVSSSRTSMECMAPFGGHE